MRDHRIPTIERLHRPDDAMVDACIRRGLPVVFTGVAEDWTPQRKWTLDYLGTQVGQTEVEVVCDSSRRVHWDPLAGLPIRKMSFAEFLSRLDREELDGPRTYLQDDVNNIPSLKEDCRLPPMMASRPIKRAKLWISGRGLETPLHYDPVETFHWTIRGEKRWLIFPPGLRSFYPNGWRTTAPFISQIEDPAAPDRERYPRFARLRPIELVMQEGDVLYLPAFWWHHVTSEGSLNISLNYVWFASVKRNLRFLPSFARCGRHILRQLRRVARAKRVSAG